MFKNSQNDSLKNGNPPHRQIHGHQRKVPVHPMYFSFIEKRKQWLQGWSNTQKFDFHFFLISFNLPLSDTQRLNSFPAATNQDGVRVIPCVLEIPYSQRTTCPRKKPERTIANIQQQNDLAPPGQARARAECTNKPSSSPSSSSWFAIIPVITFISSNLQRQQSPPVRAAQMQHAPRLPTGPSRSRAPTKPKYLRKRKP